MPIKNTSINVKLISKNLETRNIRETYKIIYKKILYT